MIMEMEELHPGTEVSITDTGIIHQRWLVETVEECKELQRFRGKKDAIKFCLERKLKPVGEKVRS